MGNSMKHKEHEKTNRILRRRRSDLDLKENMEYARVSLDDMFMEDAYLETLYLESIEFDADVNRCPSARR